MFSNFILRSSVVIGLNVEPIRTSRSEVTLKKDEAFPFSLSLGQFFEFEAGFQLFFHSGHGDRQEKTRTSCSAGFLGVFFLQILSNDTCSDGDRGREKVLRTLHSVVNFFLSSMICGVGLEGGPNASLGSKFKSMPSNSCVRISLVVEMTNFCRDSSLPIISFARRIA